MRRATEVIRRLPAIADGKAGLEGRAPLRLILVLVAMLLGLALLLRLSAGYHAAFLTLNELGQALPENFWAACTVLGDTRVALVLLLFVVARRPQLLAATLLAAIPCALLVQLSKRLYSQARPPAVFEADTYHQIGVVLKSGSFPSGHSATFAVLVALLLCSTERRWLRGLGLLALVLVASSRVMVGVHWPVDVLVGSAVGLLSGLGGFWLTQRYALATRPLSQWLLLLFPLYAAFSVPFYHSGYPQTHLWAVLLTSVALLVFVRQRFDPIRRLNALSGAWKNDVSR